MKYGRLLVLTIGLAILCSGIYVLTKAEPEKTVDEYSSDPCHKSLEKDIIFNGIWIGMPKAEFNSGDKPISIDLGGVPGAVTYEARWRDGILIKLLLRIESDKPYATQSDELTMMQSALLTTNVYSEIITPRLSRCTSTNLENAQKYESEYLCGRVKIHSIPMQGIILISDYCTDQSDSKAKYHSDSVLIEGSKSLFR